MATQIKIFFCNVRRDKSAIESEVNDFISDKNVIDIQQSECIEGHDKLYSFTLTVVYEE